MPEDDFEFPILTVDAAVFQLIGDELTVLLIERGFEPFLGWWALPGMYIAKEETSKQALNRVLAQKTGVNLHQLTLVEQPYAFDAPARDPRGYAVTVMYMALGRNIELDLHAEVQNPRFFPVTALPKLAYDHAAIVTFAHNRLKALASQSNVVASLLPKSFTFSQLQTAYEAIFCHKLDKRNFRKKITSMDMLKETGEMAREGAHRPARLYTFKADYLRLSPELFA